MSITEPKLKFLDTEPRLFIGGEWVSTGSTLPTVNPASGAVLTEVPVAGEAEVDAAVQAATRAFPLWRDTAPTQRAALLWRLGDLVGSHLEELATIEVLDNGKPIGEARAVDIALTVEVFRYYAGWTTKVAGSVYPNSIGDMLSMGRREPVGVVAAITPWNFPLLEVAYKLGPGLAVGCTVVVKPSELAPLSTIRLAQLIEEAGFPAGVVNVVIGGPDVGRALVRHPGVRKIAFTGQTSTGKQILAASAEEMKPVNLELGGKSPNIVFADADLDRALAGAFGGIFFNQGQACVAGSRLFVEEPIAAELVGRSKRKSPSRPPRPWTGPCHRYGAADLGPTPRPGAQLHQRGKRRWRRRGDRGKGGHGRGLGERVFPPTHRDFGRPQFNARSPGGDFRACPLRHLLGGR